MATPALPNDIRSVVANALAEDVGAGDLTAALLDARKLAVAHVVTREPATLCGRAWFDEVFRQLDPNVAVTWNAADGDRDAHARRSAGRHAHARARYTQDAAGATPGSEVRSVVRRGRESPDRSL